MTLLVETKTDLHVWKRTGPQGPGIWWTMSVTTELQLYRCWPAWGSTNLPTQKCDRLPGRGPQGTDHTQHHAQHGNAHLDLSRTEGVTAFVDSQ